MSAPPGSPAHQPGSPEQRPGRKPTHNLRVMHLLPDGRKSTNTAGVAWFNDDGSVTINLRPGVVLAWNDGLTINIFPMTEREP